MIPSSQARIEHWHAAIAARMRAKDWSGSAELAARCREAFPVNPAGWLLGSIAALSAGLKEVALQLVDDRLSRAPTDVQCLVQRAECLLALGRRAEALTAADAAFHNAQGHPEALDAIGSFLVHAAAHGRALHAYDAALAAAAHDPALLAKRAVVHRFLGNFELAAQDHEAVLRVAPNDADALQGLAELRRQSADHNHVARMESALRAAHPGSAEAATLHFGLAKSYDDLGDHDASWRHLSAGNHLERRRFPYQAAQDEALITCLIESFPEIEAARADTTGVKPIFIVGLPRTGTTLVERIIGNHSQVDSAGELAALSEAITIGVNHRHPGQRLTWLEHTAALAHVDVARVAREYLALARARRGERPRFSDKQPVNFFYCALILRAFPAAKIVHVTRHPMAACHAIYKTLFNGTFPFSYDLAELAEFYVGYRRLMRHWHQVLPGRIFDVAYEDIVTALEPTTRRLLDYLDLPFETACLDFHLNPRSTSTASAVQVRQPLYTSSLEHWRRYAVQLEAVRARLENAGISVD